MRVQAFGVSNIGCVRTENQDCVASWSHLDSNIELGVLADGMGGYAGGEMASRLAVDSVVEVVRERLLEADYVMPSRKGHLQHLLPILMDAGQEANRTIRRAQLDYPEFADMGTTLVAAIVSPHQALIMHAGDSRCYKISRGANGPHLPEQITRDDTVVQAMLDQGLIEVSDAERVPYRNMLTRALGPQDAVEFSSHAIPVMPGDFLLLCSDGFYNVVSTREMVDCIQANAPLDEKVDRLIETSIQNKATDNTSVVLMQVS